MNLECSSKGDRRFSAFYAMLKVRSGATKSIETLYQQSKRDASGNIAGKGKPVNFVIIGGEIYTPEVLTAWYNYLWLCYFKQNPELLNVIKDYDTFSDMFRGHCVNCQADVIQLVHDKGLAALEAISNYHTFKEVK